MLSFVSLLPGKSSPTVSVGHPTLEARSSDPAIVSLETLSRLDASCAVTCCNLMMVVIFDEYLEAHVVRMLSRYFSPKVCIT